MSNTDNLIPLSRVVKASIIDTWGDIGQMYELHSHWVARGLRELESHILKSGRRNKLLQVNHNTQTATLPCDVDQLLFVGYIRGGKKISLQHDGALADMQNITQEPVETCDKCGQVASICNDLTVTETVSTITINDVDYEQTVVKKLYPNGAYYLETTSPYVATSTNTTAETPAVASIVVYMTGVAGDPIEIFVNDPVEGIISLGAYAQSDEDLDAALLAASIAAKINENTYGYNATAEGYTITITAAAGLGATINDNNDERLTAEAVGGIVVAIEQFLGGVSAVTETIETVEFSTSKEFITALDLQACGCLATTPENLCTLERVCPEVFACHYAAPCDDLCGAVNYGGYRYFPETGLLQLDFGYTMDTVYVEYTGFIAKINGQYMVPAMAFETLVEYTKFKSIEGKQSVSNPDKRWRWEMFLIAKGNLRKVKGRFSLAAIMQAAMQTPKFDIRFDQWRTCFTRNAEVVAATETAATCPVDDQPQTTTVVYVTREDAYGKIQFTIGAAGAPMLVGNTTYILRTGNSGTGVPVQNVKTNSVNVVVDGITLSEGQASQLSHTITYTAAATTLTFNQGAITDQKYRITYAKAV